MHCSCSPLCSPHRLMRWVGLAHLVSDGADGLGQGGHQLAQLGVGSGSDQVLGQRVTDGDGLRSRERTGVRGWAPASRHLIAQRTCGIDACCSDAFCPMGVSKWLLTAPALATTADLLAETRADTALRATRLAPWKGEAEALATTLGAVKARAAWRMMREGGAKIGPEGEVSAAHSTRMINATPPL